MRKLPHVRFPDSIHSALSQYRSSTGDDCGYIAQFSVEHPEKCPVDPRQLRLYAAYSFAHEEPYLVSARIWLSWSLYDVGRHEIALSVLFQASEDRDLQYFELAEDHPLFHMGFMLHLLGRDREAILNHNMALRKKGIRNDEIILCHRGYLYHLLSRFSRARGCYQAAIAKGNRFHGEDLIEMIEMTRKEVLPPPSVRLSILGLTL